MYESLTLINGQLRNKAENLDQSTERKGKGRDKGQTTQQHYSCNLLIKLVGTCFIFYYLPFIAYLNKLQGQTCSHHSARVSISVRIGLIKCLWVLIKIFRPEQFFGTLMKVDMKVYNIAWIWCPQNIYIFKWNSLPEKAFWVAHFTVFSGFLMSHQPGGWGIYCFWCGSHRVSVLFHFRALPSEPVDGFWPNLHRYIFGRRGRINLILVTLTLFSKSQGHFEMSKIWFPFIVFWTGWWILTKLA